MASQGYYDWEDAGRPYALVRPAAKTQANIRQHGLTVYDYPDDSHLKASKPEDHTPFSATGWPVTSARWRGHALDIMPRADTEEARDENTLIALQMIEDKDNDYPGARWIKYINYTDDDGNTWHVSWQPHKAVSSSNDAGHVHVSGRSDMDNDTQADEYDPVARMNGDDMELNTPIPDTQTTNATAGRNNGQTLGDLEKNRLIDWGEIKQGDTRYPPPNSPKAKALALPDQVAALSAKMDAILAAIQASGGGVTQAQVVAALKSPDGQTAIVDAVNYAENH